MRFAQALGAVIFAGAAAGQPPNEGHAVYEHGSVAADHWIASEAGAEILRAGGNAVDAAVAASFTLSVVRPYSCGIGGGGFMVIALTGDPKRGTVRTALNYRERCPAGYDPGFFDRLDREGRGENASTQGGAAVCVPGTVKGLLHALDRYGTLARDVVMAPAIRAAEEGFEADAHYVQSTRERECMGYLNGRPDRQARARFLWERFLRRGAIGVGDRIRLPEQAGALRAIASEGEGAFYRGAIGEAIVRAVNGDGGVMTMDDLRGYTVDERPALEAGFGGWTLLMMPPPSSGGIAAAEALGILERRADFTGLAHNSAPYVHLVTEALKHAFADRARWVADPWFADVPTARLLSPAYLSRLAGSIDPDRTLAPGAYGSGPALPEDGGTSHVCAMDRWGGAVSCTETINLIFGSLLDCGYGFILNNEMDDFVTRSGKANAFGLVEGDVNLVAPGKRPLSSMTPIVGFRDGRASLVVGGAGGPRIITATLQVALNVMRFDMSAWDAVRAARFHHQGTPDTLQFEPALKETGLPGGLASRGHATGLREYVGVVQLIRRTPAGFDSASDPRKGGRPAGY